MVLISVLLESWHSDATTGRYGSRISYTWLCKEHNIDEADPDLQSPMLVLQAVLINTFRTQREYIYAQLPRTLSSERGACKFQIADRPWNAI